MILVREGKPIDIASIAVFQLRMAMETEDLRLDPSVVERGVEGVFEKTDRGTYYIAEVDGVAAGSLMITHEWSDWRAGDIWWLQSVYVLPEFRKQGVFRAMLEHVASAAKAAEVVAIRLYVEVDNDAAKATYRKLGFEMKDYAVMQHDLPA